MAHRFQTVKGTRDLLPKEARVWVAVEDVARRVFHAYGYGEIRTPLLESTDLFVRSVGESTDIVGKQMYTFEDRKGRSLTLRPESTASVARAVVQHGLGEGPLPLRLFYIGPHFRYERPQKGRSRQFHQIGAELLGDPGPFTDAELIVMLVRFLEELGFRDLVVLLNTVGDADSRATYRAALQSYLEPHRERLSADSQRRLQLNPLRILDTKNPQERQLLEKAPSLNDYLSEASRAHFDRVQTALEAQGVAFRLEPKLVRGLDYYTRTVFEIVSSDLGAQDALVGGGRYDGLVESLGGKPLTGIGFAIGEDRLVEVLPVAFRQRVGAERAICVAGVGISGLEVLKIAEELRGQDLAVRADLSEGSLKSALKAASRTGARWVVLLGADELAAGEISIKDLDSGEQVRLPRAKGADHLKKQVKNQLEVKR